MARMLVRIADARSSCPGLHRRCVASELIDVIRSPIARARQHEVDTVDISDPRWPICCDAKGCDYVFDDEDVFRVIDERLYRRADNEKWCLLSSAPIGAMW